MLNLSPPPPPPSLLFFYLLSISCVHYNTGLESNTNNSIKTEVFWADVAPIIKAKCVNCHYPEGSAPIDLSSYEKITGRHAMIKYVIENDLMPPWFARSNTVSFKDDISLTPNEKSNLIKWISNGLKKKKGTKISLTKKKAEGIQHPDYSIKLPQPKKISATGFMGYHIFTVQTNWTKDKWIKELEFVIKPKIVHHITFRIVDNIYNKRKLNNSAGSYSHLVTQLAWAPGMKKHSVFQNESGIKIPKNSKINVYIHYEPIGKEIVDDTTKVHFLFHTTPPKNQIVNLKLNDFDLKIPANNSHHKSEMTYPVTKDLKIIGVAPHMHLRGKASAIFIKKPNTKQILLNLDSWNFNFQNYYWFKKPFTVHKGSQIKCINWFDNSSKNVVNPEPNKIVYWGIQTEDEMSTCVILLLLPVKHSF